MSWATLDEYSVKAGHIEHRFSLRAAGDVVRSLLVVAADLEFGFLFGGYWRAVTRNPLGWDILGCDMMAGLRAIAKSAFWAELCWPLIHQAFTGGHKHH